MGTAFRYGPDQQPEKEGTLMFAEFMLEKQWFAASDSAQEHNFNFNEAISFMINCHTQSDIDYYWKKLSAVPEAEQCGWLKDKYGVSWQVIPDSLENMLADKDTRRVARVTNAFLKMKKFDLATLESAYNGA